MIELEKRKAIYQMHLAGMSAREISERMGVSRGTVKGVIELGCRHLGCRPLGQKL